MRLSKTSILKLKKYIDILRAKDMYIEIFTGQRNYILYHGCPDSIPDNEALCINVCSCYNNALMYIFTNINQFLRHFSHLK